MSEDDRRRSIQAEATIKHLEDQTRFIDATTPVVKEVMAPIKRRGKLNGYIKEAEDFIRGL